MKLRPLLAALFGIVLVAVTVQPPGGTRYFSQSVPPSPTLIRALGRSHLSLVADLFWIRAISTTITLKVPADGRTLVAWCALVADLDPHFIWPYMLGGLLGPMTFGTKHYNVAEANALLERGEREFPQDYRLPMYLSYNQLHLQGDAHAAGLTLQRGSKMPGAPRFMAQLATRLLAQSNAFEAGRSFAMELEQSAPDPETRAFFAHRRREIERDQRIAELQGVVDAYRAARGRLPGSLEALVSEQLIPALPPEPLGGQYRLEGDGRVVSTSGRRLEAHFKED